MKSNWLLITQNNDHSYLNYFAQTLQEHPADVGVLQGSSNVVHYLPNIATASYDTVLIAQSVLQNAPVEAYIHWLRVLKPEGNLCLQCNNFNQIKATLVQLNPIIADIRTLDDHSFTLAKKSYIAGDSSFLLTLGAAQEAQQAYDQAIGLYHQAALWHATNEQIYYRQFMLYQRLGWHAQAENALQQFYLCQQTPALKFQQAQLILQTQDYPRGFRQREEAIANVALPHRSPHPPEGDDILAKRWQRQSPKGKTFVIWSELSSSDEIMFAQLAYLFKRQLGVAKLIVLAHADAVALLQSHPDIDEALDVTTWRDSLTEFDYWEFPYALLARFDRPFETLPKRHPYLFAEKTQKRRFIGAFPLDRSRARIGLAWRNTGIAEGDIRAIYDVNDLDALITAVPNAHWVCLQQQLTEAEKQWLAQHNIAHFSDEIGNLAELAGLMAHLDFVVSTDTPVVHLAGAMGIDGAVILSAPAYDWRWGIAGSPRNVWYPTVANWHTRDPLASWQEVVAEAAERLHTHFQAASRAL